MNVMLRGLVADLWLGTARWRSLLVIVTAALGVAAFTALLASATVLTREVGRGYAATEPADFTLVLRDTDGPSGAAAAAVTAARGVPGVARAEARGTWRGRVRIGPLQWRALHLHVPASFEHVSVSRFFAQRGGWPGDDEILVERDAMQVLRAGVGDPVVVRDHAGTERTLRVAGTVYDPGQAQARMEDMVYGYATPRTLERLGDTGGLDRVLVRLEPAARADAKAIAGRVTAAVVAAGVHVTRTDFATGHPHAALMRTLFHIEGVFGLLALLFAAFACVQLFTAQMATQVRQVGVLKALGASAAQIRRRYLLHAAVLGVGASLAGLPLGLLGGGVLSRFLAVYLNFDLRDLAVGPWPYAAAVAAGVGVPVAAAWLPVRRGSRLPVAAAVVQHGVGARPFGARVLDRAAMRWLGGWLPAPVVIAARNTLRRRARSAFAVATIAIGGFCFLAAADARATLLGGLDRFFGSRGYDLTLELGSLQRAGEVDAASAGVDGIAAVEGSITARATLTPSEPREDQQGPGAGFGGHVAAMLRHHGGDPGPRPPSLAAPTFQVEAIPAGSTMHRADVVAGRMLAAGDRDGVVVNDALAGLAGGVRVGDTLAFTAGGQPLAQRVVGIVREPFAQPGAYVLRDEGAFAGHPGRVNTLRLRFASPDAAVRERSRADLERRCAAAKVPVTGSRTTAETRHVFDQHFVMVYDCLVGIAALVLLVGAVALVSLLGLDTIERRAEFAVLRALGARSRTIAGLVLVQGGLLAGLGWGVAMLAASGLAMFGGVARLFPTRLDPLHDGAAPWLWLGVAALAGLLASVLPALRASRTTIRAAMARG